jgi:N-acyl-D-amino-acid deacylase
VNEVLRIGREANIPVHISHIKALGADVWGQSDTVIRLVRQAQAQGLRVTADQYPYTASGTSVGASLLPRWAEVGGRDSLRARTADGATRARLVGEMKENMRRRGGASMLLITGGRDPGIRGKTLEQVAQARSKDPIDAAIDIILAGDASVASFNMRDDDIERFMKEPWVATGSDGSDGHPRKYGTFPRVFATYVREKHVLSLEEAVQRSSARTAQTLGLRDRGTITEGLAADIAVFDPATIVDRSTYEQPTRLAEGVRYVLVNGVLAVDGGRATGKLAGHALRKHGKPDATP